MDLESEVREKQVSYIYMGSEKIGIDNLIYKTETEAETQMQRTSVWIPKGKVGVG